MKRQLAILLLLTLSAWFSPTSVLAEEKTETIFSIDESLKEPQTLYKPYTNELIQKRTISNRTIPRKTGFCSCVLYVKAKTGYTQSVGAAKNFPVNSKIPTKGAVIVTYESSLGHVGIVSYSDDQYVYLESEANYSRCSITYGRKIALNSPLIKGYYQWNSTKQ